jgi:hypothetical protein
MSQFNPLPAGARAPLRLPSTSGYVTAQTGGLGGQDNVTLISTPTPVPVNSPQLSGSQGTELASFSITPTASVADARSSLTQSTGQSIDSCGGAAQPVTLSDGTAATTCPTLDGASVNWSFEEWKVQVVTLSGTSPSLTEASAVASELTSVGLPESDVGGFVSVVVPASASVGGADTAALEWTTGPDEYQVRSSDNPKAAIEVASAMVPYPAG